MTLYKIGQLLYIIANKSRTIEPVQVISKQTMENLQGTSVQHMCENIDGTAFSLEVQDEKQMLAGVFVTVEEAESHLLKLAAEMVHNLADAAREKALLLKPVSHDADDTNDEDSDITVDGEVVSTISLSDGTTARARIHYPPDLR